MVKANKTSTLSKVSKLLENADSKNLRCPSSVSLSKKLFFFRVSIFMLLNGWCASYAQMSSSCLLEPPAGWLAASVRWDGACTSGRAEGLGVMKELDGIHVKRIFFGRVKNGAVQIGVIESPQGLIAGHFKNGELVPSDSRQTYIDALNTGAKAASEIAYRYHKNGSEVSSHFYENKAKALREQMD